MSILWFLVGIVIGTFCGAAFKPSLLKAWAALIAFINRTPKDPTAL